MWSVRWTTPWCAWKGILFFAQLFQVAFDALISPHAFLFHLVFMTVSFAISS